MTGSHHKYESKNAGNKTDFFHRKKKFLFLKTQK